MYRSALIDSIPSTIQHSIQKALKDENAGLLALRGNSYLSETSTTSRYDFINLGP